MKKCFVSMLVAVATTTMVLLFSACGGESDDDLHDDEETLYAIEDENGKWGYIDKKGNVVIEPQFDRADLMFSEGLAAVKVGGRYGYINMDGEFEIRPQFYHASEFIDGIARVSISSERYGYYINKRGDVLFNLDSLGYLMEDGPRFSEGLLACRDKNSHKSGFLNKEGQVAIPCQYDGVRDFSDGLAAVRVGNQWGFIDKNGHIVIEPQFDNVNEFSEGMAAVGYGDREKRWSYVNRNGRLLNRFYDEARQFSQGLAAVRIGERWSYIDKDGNTILDLSPYFKWASEFSKEGLAVVGVKNEERKNGDRYSDWFAVIDRTGKLVMEFDTRELSEMIGYEVTQNEIDANFAKCKGLAYVKFYGEGDKYEKRWGWLDETGKFVWIKKLKLRQH